MRRIGSLRFLAPFLALAMVVLSAGVAFADNIQNDVVTGANGKVITIKQGDANGATVGYRIAGTGGDGISGCNASVANPATVTPTAIPAGITKSPPSLSFTNCDNSYKQVTFKASSSAQLGSFTIGTSVVGLGTYNTSPSTFTLKVESGNTPPEVFVTGVVHNGSYQYGGLPAPGCLVTDAEDNSPSATPDLTSITGPNASYGLGSQTATCSYTDGGSISRTASASYSIVDDTAPVLTTPANITQEATSPLGAPATWDKPSAQDNVPQPLSVGCDRESGDSFEIGTTTVHCSATDVASNIGHGSFDVVIKDTTAPEVSVPEDLTMEATSAAGASASWSGVAATDIVDGAVPVTCDQSSGDTFPLGVTLVSCSATDSHNNAGSKTFTITIEDKTAPDVSVPADIIEEAMSAAGASVSWNSVSAHDIVDGALEVSCDKDAGGIFPLGATLVTCSSTDNHGNAGYGSFTITVQDTTAPSLDLPADKTVEATKPAGAEVSYSASASDIVDGNVSVNCVPASDSTFALTTTTITCSASDAHGNSTKGTFSITVEDTTPPQVAVPPALMGEATSSSGRQVSFAASATDIVDGSISPSCSPASDAWFPLGTTSVTCSASDSRGNMGRRSFDITIQDTTAPSLRLPSNITVTKSGPGGTTVTYSASATDLVDGPVAVDCSKSSGDTFPLGTTTVSCSATDVHGNMAAGSFTVAVVYAWSGFFRPIDNPTVLNVAKAGSAIPAKFSLGGNQGMSVFESGYPISGPTNCDSSASLDAVEQTVTAGSSSLSYDASTDTYNYVWKTQSSWANSCRQFVIKLADGTYHRANFKFTK